MSKKVLFCSENSKALSGFGTYYREVLSRIYDNPNFEVAEFATGATIFEILPHVKWKFYPNNVSANDPRHQQFTQHPQSGFGAWRFDKVLLDFKPDIVASIKDPWMFQHECDSHLRPFFHQILMPTIDSVPQQENWIDMFRNADSIFTYSDWAIPELAKACPAIDVIHSAYSGVDLNIFKPLDKKAVRKKHGIPEDAYIIGMVSRNQIRKLYPNLFHMFRLYLDKYGHTPIGKKTLLLVHTSYPDNGWEIPDLLRDYGIANRVIFSYTCRNTKKPFFSYFEGARTFSNHSGVISGTLPSAGAGFDYQTMSELYNMLDLYIQYTNCEGLGMSQCEAAACGTPVASTNYSAMADVVKKTNGFALPVQALSMDFGVRAWRATPDDVATADIIYKYLNSKDSYKATKSKQARNCAEKHFNWDITAKMWADHLEDIQLTGLQGQWDAPIRCGAAPEFTPKEGLNNSQFVFAAIITITGNSDLFYSKVGTDFITRLNLMAIQRDEIVKQIKAFQTNKYQIEQVRCGQQPLMREDFMDFADSFGV